MPSWPSSNKAVTTALDSQNDDPNLARPEIKKNVDNVNDIIDFINPTSLADGDILQYVNANTRFENKTLASAGIAKESTKKPLFPRESRNKVVKQIRKSPNGNTKKVKEIPIESAPKRVEKIVTSTSTGVRNKMKNNKTKKGGNPKNFSKKL